MAAAAEIAVWYDCPDVVRKVLACLTSLQDVLQCDRVCKAWYALQVPVPASVCIRTISTAQKAWLQRNASRVQHMTIETLHSNDHIEQEVFPQICAGENKVTLVLKSCPNLTHLPACITELRRLEQLQILRCPCFQALPENIGGLKSLQLLDISAPAPIAADVPTQAGFAPLEAAVASADLFNFGSLAGFGRCCALRALPGSIGSLGHSLRTLRLQGCPFLEHIPDSIGDLHKLTQLFIDTSDNDEPEYQPYTYQPSLLKAIPSSIGQLQSLQHLRLRGCNALTSLPDSLGNLTALTTLQFIGCHSLASLPDSLVQLKALQCLVIDGVNALEKLPDAVGGLSSLKRFFTGYCHKLQRVPPSIGKLGSLTELHLGCHGLVDALPESLGQLMSLKELYINNGSLQNLPMSLGALTNMTSLALSHCMSLQELPDTLGGCTALRRLVVNTCTSIAVLPNSTTNLSNLEELVLHCTQEYQSLLGLPADIGNLRKLAKLHITSESNTVVYPALPGSIAEMASLRDFKFGRVVLVVGGASNSG